MVKVFQNKWVLAFMLIPFIYPIGLDEFVLFKYLFIAWEIVAIFLSVYLYIPRMSKRSFITCLILYQGLMLFITLIEVGGIGEGLKKLFVFPFSCIICELWSRKNPRLLLKVMIDILCIEQIFNLLLWQTEIFGEGHTLLGIRTDLPVIGFLSIYIAILCLYFKIEKTKIKAWISIISSVFCIFSSWVSTGIGGILILIIMIFILKTGKFEKILNICDNKKLIPIAILINVGIVFAGAQTFFGKFITDVVGESMTLNGRTYIWTAALKFIKQRPIWGYGVYGVYVPVQWGASYNYVHTQSLQLLLDGGIVLTIAFLILLFSVAKAIDKNNDYYVKKISTIILFCCLIMMTTEVFTQYCYFWILFAMLASESNFNCIIENVRK